MTTSTSDASAEHHTRFTRNRWPQWVGYATATWSGAYGLLGLYWALGGAAFPFDEESSLAGVEPEATGWVVASLGLLGTLVAVAMSSRRPRHRLGGLAVFAWVLAVGLTVLIPDTRPMIAIIRAPMILIGTPLGLVPEGLTAANFFPTFLPWPVLNQVVLMVGGLLWAGTAVSYRRRLDHACLQCGRSDHEESRWTTPRSAARWGRWAVAVAVAVPVGYAATRWAWALDIPLGVSSEALDEVAAESPGIWWAGAILATLSLAGAALTLGLVQKWGEVYPRWMPGLRGRTVRPRTAIIPASVIAVLITSTGLSYVWATTSSGRPGGCTSRSCSFLCGAPVSVWPPSPITCGGVASVEPADSTDGTVNARPTRTRVAVNWSHGLFSGTDGSCGKQNETRRPDRCADQDSVHVSSHCQRPSRSGSDSSRSRRSRAARRPPERSGTDGREP